MPPTYYSLFFFFWSELIIVQHSKKFTQSTIQKLLTTKQKNSITFTYKKQVQKLSKLTNKKKSKDKGLTRLGLRSNLKQVRPIYF